MKRRVIQILSALLCSLTVFSCFAVNSSAAAFSYKSAANGVSSAYKNSRFYKNLTQIQLTGDGVTDVLAVALTQVGYVEGTNEQGFGGTQGGGGNYTEYTYNMGKVGSYSYAWCAAFVSWCLLQSGCTTQNTQGAWCRNHEGDKNYIWREVGCYRWYNQLKRFGYGHAADGKYTPKSGDLVFFESSEHIGIVRYAKDGMVYTIEGNTSKSGFNAEGGGVFCKSYKITGGQLRGFGALPYKVNNNASKVDYSGAKPSTGLWISETEKYLYPDTKMSNSSSYTRIPKGTAFVVTKILSKDCFEAKYDGKTGYISVNSASPIYQITSNAPATNVPDKIETEIKVTPNKYAVNDDIKKVKEHVGSGITKYTLDGTKINENEVYVLNAGQKFGISGFAGFTAYIKDVGYYFDGNVEGAVWRATLKEPTTDVKKKAGEKAKSFELSADTTALTNGAHTVTVVIKFLNNKTCDLITLNLDVGGTGAGCADGSESVSGGVSELGCGSAIGTVTALPIILLAGAVIFKKKKED